VQPFIIYAYVGGNPINLVGCTEYSIVSDPIDSCAMFRVVPNIIRVSLEKVVKSTQGAFCFYIIKVGEKPLNADLALNLIKYKRTVKGANQNDSQATNRIINYDFAI